MSKEILTIHDLNDSRKIFNFPLFQYDLAFDDGLFSQYYYWPILRVVKTKKIFFISTDLIGSGKPRQQFRIKKPEFLNFPDTFESMKLYKTKNIKDNYMNIEELKIISESKLEDVEIGGHGHKHYHIQDYGKKEKEMTEDTEQMLEWFQKNLNIVPTSYAYPFYEYDEVLESILKKFGFKFIIGNRKQIEDEPKN